MHVIGTAGHVDHGKSTLVKALTGIDPDRLKEEKEREMTIDLGFAWIKQPDKGPDIGIIDVPGHRDFIENMLAGVGGIDLALIAIAADEGVMPQTLEHLAILELLNIPKGVVALTKLDLVEDPDWLELVRLDVEETLSLGRFEAAPIVPVSVKTGEGIAELRNTLISELGRVKERPDQGKPRLPIDRVFSLTGFGTVVTGTLSGGALKIGDPIELQPGGITARIRGLQTHNEDVNEALPGSRVAVNLSGAGADLIRRGLVLSKPGYISPTILCDVEYEHLPNARKPLKHNRLVKMHVGAAEVMARTRVIGQSQIAPGSTGWLQLDTFQPIAVLRNDRFILRQPSPATTLGGGRILNPHPGRKHRRYKKEVRQHYKIMSEGDEQELVLQRLNQDGPMDFESLISQTNIDRKSGASIRNELVRVKQIIELDSLLMSTTWWEAMRDKIRRVVQDYHRQFPLRRGIAKEELRSRLRLRPEVYGPILKWAEEEELVSAANTFVQLPDHAIAFTADQERMIERLFDNLASAGVNSRNAKEIRFELGNELFFALVEIGRLVPISEDVVYTKEQYVELVSKITEFLKVRGKASAADVRDLLNTSRKYAIALLEHMDQNKITKRVGDQRILNQVQM